MDGVDEAHCDEEEESSYVEEVHQHQEGDDARQPSYQIQINPMIELPLSEMTSDEKKLRKDEQFLLVKE